MLGLVCISLHQSQSSWAVLSVECSDDAPCKIVSNSAKLGVVFARGEAIIVITMANSLQRNSHKKTVKDEFRLCDCRILIFIKTWPFPACQEVVVICCSKEDFENFNRQIVEGEENAT